MNDLAAPFRQLVERRLWPIAAVLVLALAAVPFLLAKSGSNDPVPGPTASTSEAQGDTSPIVSVAAPEAREKARKVLGSAKNPFRPAIAAKAVKTPKPVTAVSTATVSTPAPVSSGSTSGGSTVPSTPQPLVPVTPAVPQQTFELHSLIVRWGDTSAGEPAVRNLERLKGLPGGSPKLVYLGLLADQKTAVFLVDASAKIEGDGKCQPSPADCQTLRMKAGDTVFVTLPGGKQYEMDLVKVVTNKTHSAAVAAKARAATASNGRKVLRANLSRVGRYRYSKRTGVLKVVPWKTWKASEARAAKAAKAAKTVPAAATPAAQVPAAG